MFTRKAPDPAPDAPAPSATPTQAARQDAVPQEPPVLPGPEELLVPGEELIETLRTENRDVSVTTHRIIIKEHRGSGSVIARDQISAFEVSSSGDGGVFVKIFFGGGLSRILKVGDAREAGVLVSVVAR